MKYTEENIAKLERVFKIMVTLSDVKDPATKRRKLHQVCQLLYEAGMIDDPKNVAKAIKIYDQYLLDTIRKIVQKNQ